jgi:antitoxin VapB
MGMNIKNPEAHALAREIAARTGLSLTDAVLAALREKRAALAGPTGERARADRLLAYGRRLTEARGRTAAGTAPPPTSDTDDLYDATLGLPE